MPTNSTDGLRQRAAEAPLTPGVYLMRDGAGTILYIGKARRLRARLQSYRRGDLDRKTAKLMEKVAAWEWQETGNEVDALILESQLVKKFQPRYNILLRDDKRFPYLVLTTSEEYPRLLRLRRVDKQRDRYYGPFPDQAGAKHLAEQLRRSFRLRRCRHLKKRISPCLNAQIRLCPAPCTGGITPEAYGEIIARIERILAGKGRDLARELRGKMEQAATELKFESAATYRDDVFAVERVLQRRGLFQDAGLGSGAGKTAPTPLFELREALDLPRVPVRLEGYDIATAAAGKHAVGAKVAMQWGKFKRRDYRLYTIKTVAGSNDVAMLKEIIARRLAHAEEELPDLILVDGGAAQLAAAREAVLTAGATVPVLALAKREEAVYGGEAGGIVTIPEAARNLLIRLRDETHRFVNTAFRKRRQRETVTSELVGVPGIGPARAGRILKRFTPAELMKTEAVLAAKQCGVPVAVIRAAQRFLAGRNE